MPLSLEAVKSVCDWIALILLFLTFAVGTVALMVGNKLSDRQAEQLRKFDKDLTGAKTDLANAKSELASRQSELEKEQQKTALAQRETAEAQGKAIQAQIELNRAVSMAVRRSGDRILHIKVFTDSLAAKPKKTVEILYKPEDSEARSFSGDICRALEGLRWPVLMRPYKPNERLGKVPVASVSGIMVASGDPTDVIGVDNFLFDLLRAILFGGGGSGIQAPELAPNTIVVVIGPSMRQ